MWSGLKNSSDGALLFIRSMLGFLVLWLHGWPKLAAGIGAWRRYSINELHITLWPGFWGFLATFAQTAGCVLIIIGLWFRPSALLLVLIMALAAVADYVSGGLARSAHALELGLFFLCLLFVGPGKYSFDKS